MDLFTKRKPECQVVDLIRQREIHVRKIVFSCASLQNFNTAIIIKLNCFIGIYSKEY